jgi:hypothetical protein
VPDDFTAGSRQHHAGAQHAVVEYRPAPSDFTQSMLATRHARPGPAPPAHELVGLVQLVREHENARRAALRAGGVVAHVEQDRAHRAQRVALAHRAARARALLLSTQPPSASCIALPT